MTAPVTAPQNCAICGEPSPDGLVNNLCDPCRDLNWDERQVLLGRRIEKMEALAKNPPLVVDPNPVKR